jgi:hypothetical protein
MTQDRYLGRTLTDRQNAEVVEKFSGPVRHEPEVSQKDQLILIRSRMHRATREFVGRLGFESRPTDSRTVVVIVHG